MARRLSQAYQALHNMVANLSLARACWTLVIVGLLFLAVFVGSLRAADEAGHSERSHAVGGDSHAHKEPSALDHVLDPKDGAWELFHTISPREIHLPKVFGFQLTKFKVLELIAALLIIAIYVPMANRLRSGKPPTGAWDNAFESILTFLREQVAKPNIGEHHADHYVPFLWTLFLFILFNNLLGMFPFGGSATGSIYVTLGLAIVVFFAIHGSAIRELGFIHYIESLWPHLDLPMALRILMAAFIFVIEVFGILVRNAVLAVRLFANMFAGHMVLATILIFIYVAGKTGSDGLWATVTVSSVVGIVALSLLEIFVAFLQAFIFTFLASLFMGMAMHPSH